MSAGADYSDSDDETCTCTFDPLLDSPALLPVEFPPDSIPGELPVEIIQHIVAHFVGDLDHSGLFPRLQVYGKHRNILTKLCLLNKAWAVAVQPLLWKYVDRTPEAVVNHLVKHGHLVKAMKLKMSLDHSSSLSVFTNIRYLSNIEWLYLDLSIQRSDTVTLVERLRDSLSRLPKLRFIILSGRFRLLSLPSNPYIRHGTCPKLSAIPAAFAGSLQICCGLEVAIPTNIKALDVQGTIEYTTLLQAIDEGRFSGLSSLHLVGECMRRTDLMMDQRLNGVNLTRLWLETWSRVGTMAGLWLDLSDCTSLHTLAVTFRPLNAPGVDLNRQLPKSLRHLYILDVDPTSFARLLRYNAKKLESLVIYLTVAYDQYFFRQEQWAGVIEDAKMLLDQCQSRQVAFWPQEIVEILRELEFGIENRKWRAGRRAAWMTSKEEQQAAFMQARLPRQRGQGDVQNMPMA